METKIFGRSITRFDLPLGFLLFNFYFLLFHRSLVEAWDSAVADVAGRVVLDVVLVFHLGRVELISRGDLCHHVPALKTQLADQTQRRFLLLLIEIVDGRSIL